MGTTVESNEDPYQVGEATHFSQPGSRWPTCCAIALLVGAALAAAGVWVWIERIAPKLGQVACAGRLKDVQVGAISYANRKGTYPYTGEGFAATFALLEETGDFHMGYRPSCPLEPGYAGYDAPFPARIPHSQMVAWCESPHAGGKVIVTANGTLDVVTEARFRELKALYDQRVAKILAKPEPSGAPASPRPR